MIIKKFKLLAKLGVNWVLSLFELEVRRKHSTNRVTKHSTLKILKKLGLQPKTVIDVGVDIWGTTELYETFPNVKHVLIEPVEEYERDIMKLCERIKDVEFIKAAASNKSGISKLSVKKGLTNSTLGEITGGTWKKELMREVKVITLDEVCKKKKKPEPYLIKVDVDGKDLEVLEGASDILKKTDCVIIESGIWDICRRTQFLENRGFFLWDIVDFLYKKEVLFQVDLIFLNNKYQNHKFMPWIASKVL